MRVNYIFFFAMVVVSCARDEDNFESFLEPNFETETRDKKNELAYQQNFWLNPDTIPTEYGVPAMTLYDSLFQVELDTMTLQGKRDKILLDFLNFNSPSCPDYDSLFDLNYDSYLDYIIGFYYQAGTGFKNGIEVHLFDPKNKIYRADSLLSSIANPSFYLNEKMITGFYLPHGAGGGEQLEWVQGRWLITKSFSAGSYNEPDSTYWHINYPLTGRKDSILDLYRGIPIQKVLQNKYGKY